MGQQKRLSLGAGLHYVQDHQKSFSNGPAYVDDLNQSIAASFSIEGNFKVLKSWYINPSIGLTYAKSFKYENNASTPLAQEFGRNVIYPTYLKLSLKKVIHTQD